MNDTTKHHAYPLRPPREDEIEAIVSLMNACSLVQVGSREHSIEETLAEWQNPDLTPKEDVRVVDGADGQLIGYIEVLRHSPRTFRTWVRGYVHPDFERLGIGSCLMAWAEERTCEAFHHLPDDTPIRLVAAAVHNYPPIHHLFKHLGMTPVRYYWRMRIDLTAPPPIPQWPIGISLRPFERERDGMAAYLVVREAFHGAQALTKEAAEEGYRQWRYWAYREEDFDPELWGIAMDGEEMVGVIRCTPHRGADKTRGWINQLAVRSRWRRRGLGLALLHHAFGVFYQRDKEAVGLGVDADSPTGATRLYEKAGMRVVRQVDDYEKVLRRG